MGTEGETRGWEGGVGVRVEELEDEMNMLGPHPALAPTRESEALNLKVLFPEAFMAKPNTVAARL